MCVCTFIYHEDNSLTTVTRSNGTTVKQSVEGVPEVPRDLEFLLHFHILDYFSSLYNLNFLFRVFYTSRLRENSRNFSVQVPACVTKYGH